MDNHWFEAAAHHMGDAYLNYSFTKGSEQEVAFLIKELDLKPGMKLLDVGCGPGRHSHLFARAGITVLGIDISQKFVDILVNNSKQDSSTGDKQSWGSNSCSAGANLNSNITNIIDKKLDSSIAEKAILKYKIDPTRRYAGGLSMGGMGTFELVARNPDYFAAAFPICGGGNPKWANLLKSTPFWIFHGEDDGVVSVDFSRKMYEALSVEKASVRLTIYPDVNHNLSLIHI